MKLSFILAVQVLLTGCLAPQDPQAGMVASLEMTGIRPAPPSSEQGGAIISYRIANWGDTDVCINQFKFPAQPTPRHNDPVVMILKGADTPDGLSRFQDLSGPYPNIDNQNFGEYFIKIAPGETLEGSFVEIGLFDETDEPLVFADIGSVQLVGYVAKCADGHFPIYGNFDYWDGKALSFDAEAQAPWMKIESEIWVND